MRQFAASCKHMTVICYFLVTFAAVGPPGGPGPGGFGDGPAGLIGAGSAGYIAGSAGTGYGAGLDGHAMDGGGLGPGGGNGSYKRAYSAMIGDHGEHYSGDNFSPGLGGGDHSDDMDDDEDDDMDGGGGARFGGAGGGRVRGVTGGTSRRHSSRGRGRTMAGGSADKRVYFEYAKIQWESERVSWTLSFFRLLYLLGFHTESRDKLA